MRPLRLLVFDRTCKKGIVGLSTAWSAGSVLYRGLGRIDAAYGASSWKDALDWLAKVEAPSPIGEIQYWGHGKWGRVLVDRDGLDAAGLRAGHPLHAGLCAVRERLSPDALVWLRTCEAFGARAGQDFAARLADTLGARVAGHTFIIGAIQSGLRALRPGSSPTWSATEGLAEGTADAPVRAHGSHPRHPRTITCFEGAFPEAWFD